MIAVGIEGSKGGRRSLSSKRTQIKRRRRLGIYRGGKCCSDRRQIGERDGKIVIFWRKVKCLNSLGRVSLVIKGAWNPKYAGAIGGQPRITQETKSDRCRLKAFCVGLPFIYGKRIG